MDRHRMQSRVPLPAVGVVVALIVAGCGSDDNDDAGTPAAPPPPAATGAKARVVELSADPDGALKFTKTRLTTKPGKVTLEMANPSKIDHGVGVEGDGVDAHGPVVGPGATSTATADLRPGTYEYYCPVKSHHDAGMEGTLVVK